MIDFKFYSVATNKKIIIKQLERAIRKLKFSMSHDEKDERFVTKEYGKFGFSFKRIKWGKKQLFAELWPKKEG